MIEPELAKKFIERLTQYTDYNINIMNESGVIIASRDPSSATIKSFLASCPASTWRSRTRGARKASSA